MKSAFIGTVVKGDGTVKTFPAKGGIVEKNLYAAFGVPAEIIMPFSSSHSSALDAVIKQEFVRQQEAIFMPIRRSPELQHCISEHYWVWKAMVHEEISVDTATVLMRYCAQQIDWQTQAERAKAKHYA